MFTIAQTTAGLVRGVEADDVVAFKGVPYGDDTSGANRFLRARPPRPWTAARDCFEYGASCPQIAVGQMTGQDLPDEIEHAIGVWNYERRTSEDCLVLNVWTPGVDEARRPVLVWLHGGGMAVGSASWPLYDFTNLARKNDVVVVGVNHRLGILGFLDLSHLDSEFADAGNVGILDIVDALEWVRDNIAAFGGDPSNVTIFGESGGGSKVTTLLAMPAAHGLFRNAVAMSGAILEARTPEAARASAENALALLGVGSDVEAIRTVDVAKFTEVELQTMAGGLLAARNGFGPTLGPSLPAHPVDAVRGGSARGVNVVIGCTTHEMAAFAGTPDLWTASDEDVLQRIAFLMGDQADDVVEGYRKASPNDSLVSHYLAMASDKRFRIPHIRYAEALIEGGAASTRMYLFDFRQPGGDGVLRSGHGSDMPFFFDNVHIAPAAQGPHADPLARTMSGALVALAKRGDPNHDALPGWPEYDLTTRATMVFDVEPRVENDPLSDQRLVWEGRPIGW